jgi:hypothetical protein
MTAAPADAAPPPSAGDAATDAARTRTKLEVEREMRKIRATCFGQIRNKEIRQVGIDRLRRYTDPLYFPSLLSIFEREAMDVRGAILDHLAEQRSAEGDTTIAWGAIYDGDAEFRAAASERLAARAKEAGGVQNMVKWVIAEALKSPRDAVAANAAELAATLRLYEAIPAIINAQIRGAGASGTSIDVPVDGGSMGALADIIVATQQAFVADLQPVVGDSAVAFDPTLGVVTDGTVLRVLGASVVTYRTGVNRALVRLADSGWDGRTTAMLGWDNDRWRAWYANEFLPYRAKVEAAAAPAGGEAAPAGASPDRP